MPAGRVGRPHGLDGSFHVTRPVAELLVPLVRDAIRSIDVAARRIDVDLGFLGES